VGSGGESLSSFFAAAFFGSGGFGRITCLNVLVEMQSLQAGTDGNTSFRSLRPVPVSAIVSPFWVERIEVFETEGAAFENVLERIGLDFL
jgi:hypothetical protein